MWKLMHRSWKKHFNQVFCNAHSSLQFVNRPREPLFLTGTVRFINKDSSHRLSFLRNPESTEGTSDSTPGDDIYTDTNKLLSNYPRKIIFPRSSLRPKDVAGDLKAASSDDPNTFGTLSGLDEASTELYEGDDGDRREDDFISNKPSRLPHRLYAKMIIKLLDQRRFAEALDVLEVKMLKEDRVIPEYYIYSMLISYCGRAGYPKKAFKLYNDMKKRGLRVPPAVYTSLFNSCANSHKPYLGLNQARHLLNLMKEKGIEPTPITCNAMVKAFGRCGDIKQAFGIVDVMMAKKMALGPATFSMLFQACISQKEAGFRHAILIYHKLKQYQIKKVCWHYNLLLRCARDCDTGDMSAFQDVLRCLGIDNPPLIMDSIKENSTPASEGSWPWEVAEDKDQRKSGEERGLPEISIEVATSGSEESDIVLAKTSSQLDIRPNLLAIPATMGNVLSLTELDQPHHRLLLLGGMDGFLDEMEMNGVKPDLHTFTILLDCIPGTCASEQALVKKMKSLQLKPDIAFFNNLIKRRCYRKDYDNAKDVIDMIAKEGLKFDLITFSNLAMTCKSKEEATELIDSMRQSGLRPTIHMLGAMMRRACKSLSFSYIYTIWHIIDTDEIKVTPRFLEMNDSFYQYCRSCLSQSERTKSLPDFVCDKMRKFCKGYEEKRKTFQMDDEHSPSWKDGRVPTPTDTDQEYFSNYVEKDPMKRSFPKFTLAKKPTLLKSKHNKHAKHGEEDMGGIPIGTLQNAIPSIKDS